MIDNVKNTIFWILLGVVSSLSPSCSKAPIEKPPVSWCDRPEPMDGPDDWVDISENVHFVRENAQSKLINDLNSRKYIEVKSQEAVKYIEESPKKLSPGFIYVVRGAVYGPIEDYRALVQRTGKLPLHAEYSPARSHLSVTDFALAGPDVLLNNVPLIVVTPIRIERVTMTCLAAM